MEMVSDTENDILALKGKLKNVRRTRIILIILLITLFIVLIITYVLIEKKLCEDDLCIRSAASLLLAMNTSEDPCDDFYQFACGRWTAEHPGNGWNSPVSVSNIIEETITTATIKFLLSYPSTTEPLPVKQARDLYASCMIQKATTDELEYVGILKYLSLFGLPAIPTFLNISDNENAKDQKIDWIRTEVLLYRLLGNQSVIGFGVSHNLTDNSRYMWMGVPSVYSLPRFTLLKQQYYKNLRHAKKEYGDDTITKYNVEQTKQLLHTLIYSVVVANSLDVEYLELPEIINKTAYTIMKLSEEIEEIDSVASSLENCTKSIDMDDQMIGISVNELQDKTNEYMQLFNLTPKDIWRPYLRQMFDGLNITLNFNENDTLFVDQCEVSYLVTVARYFSELPDELIELWFWWKIVSRYNEIKNSFEEMADTTFEEPKILKCAGITKEYMGMAVSYAIADKIILNDSKWKVKNMILDIKAAFTQRIEQIQWMDKKTKILTLEKCNEMLSVVGYPDWLIEDGALEKYYSNITIHSNTYLENMLSIVQRLVKNNVEQLYTEQRRDWPLDKERDDIYPITVNAFYIPWHNSIGRQFDKYGNKIQWWDQKSIDIFEELAQCFVKQYNKFYVSDLGIYVNGTNSLNENIADSEGLRLAYTAYKKYKQKNMKELHLPGLEQYTQDQMFFIAYASTWCSDVQSDNMKYYEEEPHCPHSYRLMGSLQNSEEFSEAFHCPKGSKMNPDVPKCSIW